MKETAGVRCYIRYCDDVVGLARTKAEAKRALNAYDRASAALGLCVKASATLSPVRHTVQHGRKRKRGRQRGRKRNGH